MFLSHRLALAAMLAAPAWSMATATSPFATDPGAAVAAPAYQSAWSTYRSHSNDESPPHQHWRAANQQVRQLGGHAGHMQNADDAPPAATPAHHDHGKPMQNGGHGAGHHHRGH